MAIARFTEAFVRSAPQGQYTDAELRGFMLVVGRTRRTFYAQAMVRGGRQTKTLVGHWPEVPQVEARRRAADALAAMRRGEDPGEAERARRARSTTLREALEAHLSGRERSPRTVEGYRYNLTHYLGDWLDREVEAIGRDRAGVRERHRRLAGVHGAPTADSVMRVLRAVYGRARRQHPDLPPNPCENVDFGGTRRRRVDLDPAALLAWGPAALALDPVRRDLQLFLILSGMRSGAARSARAEHLLPGRGLLRVPSPKGGDERAFDLPLSPPLLDLLSARAAPGGWLFPARSASGHIEEVRDDALAPLVGHALRHAYTSLALEAGVPLLELKILLNHSVAGLGVTGTYVHLGMTHLREMQGRASAGILAAVGLSHSAGQWPPRRAEASVLTSS
jgi:integrase